MGELSFPYSVFKTFGLLMEVEEALMKRIDDLSTVLRSYSCFSKLLLVNLAIEVGICCSPFGLRVSSFRFSRITDFPDSSSMSSHKKSDFPDFL